MQKNASSVESESNKTTGQEQPWSGTKYQISKITCLKLRTEKHGKIFLKMSYINLSSNVLSLDKLKIHMRLIFWEGVVFYSDIN